MKDKEAFKEVIKALKDGTENAQLMLKAFTKQKWINFLYYGCGIIGALLSYILK